MRKPPSRPPGYVLTEEQYKVLQELFEDHSHRIQGPPPGRGHGVHGGWPEHEEFLSPETYIARTPTTGIPALSINTTGTGTIALGDDVPGKAECELYRLIDNGTVEQLKPMGISKLLYNFTTTAIPGLEWVYAIRDKAGKWWAVQPHTEGISDDSQAVYLELVTGVCPAVNTGTASALITVEKTLVKLPLGTEIISVTCEDDPFDCCEEDEPGVFTPCCPDRQIPFTLYMRVCVVDGCDCLDGLILPLHYNPDNGLWKGSSHAPSCGSYANGEPFRVSGSLLCDSGQAYCGYYWKTFFQCVNQAQFCSTGDNFVSAPNIDGGFDACCRYLTYGNNNCNPLDLNWVGVFAEASNNDPDSGCCCPLGIVRVRVTESYPTNCDTPDCSTCPACILLDAGTFPSGYEEAGGEHTLAMLFDPCVWKSEVFSMGDLSAFWLMERNETNIKVKLYTNNTTNNNWNAPFEYNLPGADCSDLPATLDFCSYGNTNPGWPGTVAISDGGTDCGPGTPCGDCATDDPGNNLCVTIASIASGACFDCNNIPLTSTMSRTSNPCVWKGASFSSGGVCGSTDHTAYWMLTRSGTTWTLQFYDETANAVILEYSVTGGCTMPLTMNNTSGGDGSCTGPATACVYTYASGCTPPVDCGTPDCPDCGTDPGDSMCLSVSGFTNGTFSDCANANGSITITRFPGVPCEWRSAAFTLGGDTAGHWSVQVQPGVGWTAYLFNSTQTIAVYQEAADSDCALPATLNKAADNPACSTPPASVTLDLTCTSPCTFCSGDTPVTVDFSVSNWGPDPPCDDWPTSGTVTQTGGDPCTWTGTFSAASGNVVVTLTKPGIDWTINFQQGPNGATFSGGHQSDCCVSVASLAAVDTYCFTVPTVGITPSCPGAALKLQSPSPLSQPQPSTLALVSTLAQLPSEQLARGKQDAHIYLSSTYAFQFSKGDQIQPLLTVPGMPNLHIYLLDLALDNKDQLVEVVFAVTLPTGEEGILTVTQGLP